MRVCFMTLGSRGDVQPYLALGKELIKRGHTAVICTGASFRQFVEENGVEFRETASDLMAIAETPEGKAILEHPVKNMGLALRYSKEVMGPAYRKTLDDFYTAAKGSDMIVYHPKAMGAVDMAIELGIPCVSMPLVPITFPVCEFANLAVTDGNMILTEGLVLQAEKHWTEFLGRDIIPENNSSELYFEESDIDGFVEKLESYYPEVKYVNRLMTHSWGQKVIRFYDPDGNLIEVGTPV